MDNLDTNLLNRDRIWNRVKRYIYLLVGLISLITLLLIVSIALQSYTLSKILKPEAL
jgi:hypothetical protein